MGGIFPLTQSPVINQKMGVTTIKVVDLLLFKHKRLHSVSYNTETTKEKASMTFKYVYLRKENHYRFTQRHSVNVGG